MAYAPSDGTGPGAAAALVPVTSVRDVLVTLVESICQSYSLDETR